MSGLFLYKFINMISVPNSGMCFHIRCQVYKTKTGGGAIDKYREVIVTSDLSWEWTSVIGHDVFEHQRR